jgi:hypothetical protein
MVNDRLHGERGVDAAPKLGIDWADRSNFKQMPAMGRTGF